MPPRGGWWQASGTIVQSVAGKEALARAAAAEIVLLGEQHDDEDHRWQVQVLAAPLPQAGEGRFLSRCHDFHIKARSSMLPESSRSSAKIRLVSECERVGRAGNRAKMLQEWRRMVPQTVMAWSDTPHNASHDRLDRVQLPGRQTHVEG